MKDKLGDLSREHYRLYENSVLSKQQYSDLSDMLDKAINYTQCCTELQAIEDLKEFARNNCREWNNDEMDEIIGRL